MKIKSILKQILIITVTTALVFIGTSFTHIENYIVRAKPPETVKSTNGTCPDHYTKISVSVSQGGDDCLLQDIIDKEKQGDTKFCPPDYASLNADKCILVGDPLQNNPIFEYLRAIVKFLGAGVGLVIILIIIISGIRYITSGGNPQAVEGAKKMLFAGVIGLIAFIFAFALLNYLIPGGIIQ